MRSVRGQNFLWAAVAAWLLGAFSVALAQDDTGGWVSHYNGIHNTRRAVDQHLGTNWVELWRTPRTGYGGILASEGLAIYQNNPADGNQFVAIEIATGQERWSVVTGATCGNYHAFVGCMAGQRLFLPLSAEGGSGCTYSQRIECRNLMTGNLEWTWDSTIYGSVRDLMPPPDAAHGEILAPLSNYLSPGYKDGFNSRMLALDGSFSGSGTYTGHTGPWLRESAPASGQTISATMAAYERSTGPTPNEWRVFYHEEHLVNRRWESLRLIDFDFQSFSEDGSLPLSDTTVAAYDWSASFCPLVVTGDQGLLLESGGQLRAYDLTTFQESWAIQAILSFGGTTPIPFVLPDAVVIVDQVDTGTIKAFSPADGTQLWTLVPTAPGHQVGGCVLEGNLILVPLTNGEIYGLNASGVAYGPLLTEPAISPANLGVIATNGVFLVSTTDELICYKATSPLAFGAQPDPVTAGETLTFNAMGGEADRPALLVVTKVNDTPIFKPLLVVPYLDPNGRWSLGATVPDGLAGLDVTFKFFAAKTPYGVYMSNEKTVRFR
ncbi:MAG: PQQ-binding-like beta-propeller repeat protein [Planctomycetota bacterium]